MNRNSEAITVKIFDVIDEIKGTGPAEGTKSNLLYEADEFKVRRISLSPRDEIQPCKMASNVVFYVVKGSVEVSVDDVKNLLREGECLVTEPATFSMKTEEGATILGIQISKK
jgi:quercetin dioxygenase-like cupin family protein